MHKGNENEPPLDYTDYLIDRDPPPALRDDLTDESDDALAIAITVASNGSSGNEIALSS